MKGITIFGFVAVAFTAALAAPGPGPNHSHHQAIPQKSVPAVVKINGEITPKDWLSDLIGLITGKTVASLLEEISIALIGLDDLVDQAEDQLQEIIVQVGKEAKEEIEAVVNDALGEATVIIAPLLEQLGRVLPAIQHRNNPTDVSDLIQIIIGKSLEDFLTAIGQTLIQLDKLFQDTVSRLEKIAATTAQSAASQIQTVIDDTLTKAKAIIKPVLDILEQLLPLGSGTPFRYASVALPTITRISELQVIMRH